MKWFIALFLVASVAHAERNTYFGVDFLALQHRDFPYRKAMKVFSGVDRPALGYLHGTFGRRMNGVEHFVNRHGTKPHLIRVHLYNAVCVRHGNCAPRELMPKWTRDDWNRKLVEMPKKLKRRLQDRALEVRDSLEAIVNENTRLVLSIALEDNLQDGAARNLVEVLKEVWPYDIIRNPMLPFSSPATSDALELHISHGLLGGGLYLYGSLDGASVAFKHRKPSTEKTLTPNDARAFLRGGSGRAIALFLWDGAHQGLGSGGTTAAPRPFDRNIRVDRRDIKTFRRWLKEQNIKEKETE